MVVETAITIWRAGRGRAAGLKRVDRGIDCVVGDAGCLAALSAFPGRADPCALDELRTGPIEWYATASIVEARAEEGNELTVASVVEAFIVARRAAVFLATRRERGIGLKTVFVV